jgi:dolichol-phosphate mannosyltransferase
MSLKENLVALERTRESYWQRYDQTSTIKLRWRALTVRHCFHVLPGESILEVGAGTGLWTQHLAKVLRYENEITAAVFNADFAEHARWESLPGVRCLFLESLDRLPAASFDYIVGTAILCHDEYQQHLKSLFRLLKPGGQLLFFENNFWNPQVLLKSMGRSLKRWFGRPSCQVGLRRYRLILWASQAGFCDLDAIPYDIIHPLTPRRLVPILQSVAFIFEHAPVIKDLCGTLCIRGRRPTTDTDLARTVNLAAHDQFRGAVSFVIPCHNEEMNVSPLVESLVALYDSYIYEIVIVNDNSTDRTADVAREAGARDARVKLINRKPPGGVGRALRDGYAAAQGKYIFTLDADFVHIVPEFRDLFDAVAEGYDGAVGSRFTQESIMVNYPFIKILCNRGFHLLANVVLPLRVHDVSNNLKLYRAPILKEMVIEEAHFAANAEIGLKAVLAGYRIREVPVSWINRTVEMGSSSFRITKVASRYFGALVRLIGSKRPGPRTSSSPISKGAPAEEMSQKEE